MDKELITFTDKLPRNDLSGQKFNRFTVIKPVGRYRRATVYLCQCDCGVKIMIPSTQITCGSSKSCGCLQREVTKKSKITHGMWGTPTYVSWNKMTQRCGNKKNKFYSYYGGRGISVCDSWLKFENFYEDMGVRPDGLTIDRINHNGDYNKENCLWASRDEQIRNRRNSIYIEYDGRTQYLKDWADEFGLEYSTLYSRLYKYGLSMERALNKKI